MEVKNKTSRFSREQPDERSSSGKQKVYQLKQIFWDCMSLVQALDKRISSSQNRKA
jgi:hypothetical protein